jgi:hypothetical protein
VGEKAGRIPSPYYKEPAEGEIERDFKIPLSPFRVNLQDEPLLRKGERTKGWLPFHAHIFYTTMIKVKGSSLEPLIII